MWTILGDKDKKQFSIFLKVGFPMPLVDKVEIELLLTGSLASKMTEHNQ